MQSYSLCKSEDQNCANSINTLSYSTDDHSINNYEELRVGNNFYGYLRGFLRNYLRR